MTEAAKPTEHEGVNGYERQDVNLKSLLLIGLGIAVSIAAILMFLNEYFVVEKERQVYQQVLKPESTKLRQLRAYEDEILNNYAVLDQDRGLYQIPIERAMELLADEDYRQRQSGRKQ